MAEAEEYVPERFSPKKNIVEQMAMEQSGKYFPVDCITEGFVCENIRQSLPSDQRTREIIASKRREVSILREKLSDYVPKK